MVLGFSVNATYAKIATLSSNWSGVNSYFIHTLSVDDQSEILSNLRDAHVTTVRLFINTVYGNNKGSSSVFTNDIEQDEVGTYDDTVLEMIDAFMVGWFFFCSSFFPPKPLCV
jgi:hypothetical protein